jgi:hypothetical protein
VRPDATHRGGRLLLVLVLAVLSRQSAPTAVHCSRVRHLCSTPTSLQLRGGGISQYQDPVHRESIAEPASEMARHGEDDSEWDVWAYNDAIKKSDTFEECVSLLKRMELGSDGLMAPNAVTYHGILDCALRGTRTDAKAACVLFESIPKALRNHHTYATAIRLYTMLGCVDDTARLLAEAKGHNVAPDAEMITASIESQVQRCRPF